MEPVSEYVLFLVCQLSDLVCYSSTNPSPFFLIILVSEFLGFTNISFRIQRQIWKWQDTGRIYIAGEICLVVGLVIWVTSLPQIRRKKFEIFYYTHHLYMVFLVLFLFHAGDRHFYAVFPGIFLFGLDKLLRIIQSRPETCILSAQIFPSSAIELILPKDPGKTFRLLSETRILHISLEQSYETFTCH